MRKRMAAALLALAMVFGATVAVAPAANASVCSYGYWTYRQGGWVWGTYYPGFWEYVSGRYNC